jgi:hypothetical protein
MRATAVGRAAGIIAIAIGGVAGCGHSTVAGQRSGSAGGPASLNGISASQVVGAITKAGLPALNPHDVTAQKCQALHCTQAVDTDTVSVFKFPTTGLAQKYEASTSNVYQVEDLVLAFAPSVTVELKQDYEKVVARLAA